MAMKQANRTSANSTQSTATARSIKQASEASEGISSSTHGDSQDLEALTVKNMMSDMLATSKKRRENRRIKLEERHRARVNNLRNDILRSLQSFKAKSNLSRRQQLQRLLDLVKQRERLEDDIAMNITILRTASRERVSSLLAVLASRTEGLLRLSNTG